MLINNFSISLVSRLLTFCLVSQLLMASSYSMAKTINAADGGISKEPMNIVSDSL